MNIITACLFIIFSDFSLSLSDRVDGVTFAGCFTAPPGNTAAVDITKLGWTDSYTITPGSFDRQFCINYCVQKNKKYAGISKVRNAPINYCTSCVEEYICAHGY